MRKYNPEIFSIPLRHPQQREQDFAIVDDISRWLLQRPIVAVQPKQFRGRYRFLDEHHGRIPLVDFGMVHMQEERSQSAPHVEMLTIAVLLPDSNALPRQIAAVYQKIVFFNRYRREIQLGHGGSAEGGR